MTEEMQPGPARQPGESESQTKSKMPRAAASGRKEKSGTKSDALVALLSRSRGATLEEMMKATGWQAHSVRGFLAGTLKKKLGQPVTSEVTDKGRVYRIPKAR